MANKYDDLCSAPRTHAKAILSVCSVLLQTLAASAFLFLCVSLTLTSSLVAVWGWDDGGSLLFFIHHMIFQHDRLGDFSRFFVISDGILIYSCPL